jgi:hypothetical protein
MAQRNSLGLWFDSRAWEANGVWMELAVFLLSSNGRRICVQCVVYCSNTFPRNMIRIRQRILLWSNEFSFGDGDARS